MKKAERWKKKLELLVIIFVLMSFAGWIWEVAIHLVEDGVFVKRGVLSGPWLPIYGSGSVLIVLFLGKYRDKPARLFLMTMALCGLMEYMTGWYLETVYQVRWWDYSDLRFQIQGRVCLAGLLIFGAGGLILVRFVLPAAERFLAGRNQRVLEILCLILVFLFTADLLQSFVHPNMGEGITTAVSGMSSARVP